MKCGVRCDRNGNVAGFSVDVKKYTSTLLRFDVINLNEKIQNKLLDSINREGVVLYEKV